MQYSPRKLLAALGIPIILGIAACSSSGAPTHTPDVRPTPTISCQNPTMYNDTLLPGQGYEFFSGERISSPVRHIQYRGGNSFAFLDDKGNVVTPEEAKSYSNPDGSVRFREGGKFIFRGNISGSNDSIIIEVTFKDFENNRATINVSTSECTQGLIY